MLSVYLHDRLVGTLRRKPDSGNLQFRYDEGYRAEGGPPLSQNMPVRAEAFPPRACLAFFGNLLPEEDVRAQLALVAGVSASNDYKLLERFGGDVAGAVVLLPEGDEPARQGAGSLERLTEDELDKRLAELPQRPFAADEEGKVRISLAGAQSKLPVVETDSGFAVPHGSDLPTSHILKPEPGRFPGLVANEFFCMRLAAEVGLPVAHVARA
jgi:serine/threonine-protein kinase HipA